MPIDSEDLWFVVTEERDDENPLDQLIELFVYAPVGLLYEYPDVLPKLIKRGKSQVQVAQVMAKLAMGRRGASSLDVGDVAGVAATLVGRAISDFAASMGLDPDGTPARPRSSSPASSPKEKTAPPEPAPKVQSSKAGPIDGYDDLTAREIIPMLDDLSSKQRKTVRAHELANRSRKTVLAKLDRLDK